ncbi:MAG: host-nuclease inhibitor Gam family protein [Psychrobacillus psychrodurans]
MEELQNVETEEKKPFEINNDSDLSWVFKEILIPLKQEVEHINEIAKIDFERVQKWEEDKLRGPLKGIEYWEHRISAYHLESLQKDATKKTISTPFGKVKSTTSQAQPDKGDEEKLLAFVKANNLPFIKATEEIKWGDLKKTLQIAEKDGVQIVIDENGQTVPGATVKPQTTTFKVEIE